MVGFIVRHPPLLQIDAKNVQKEKLQVASQPINLHNSGHESNLLISSKACVWVVRFSLTF